jgi:hypothetical protein
MEPDVPATDWSQPPFDAETIRRVWRIATQIPGNDPELWRKDSFGAWIHRLDFGNRRSQFGWQIAESSVITEVGLEVLRPLQWQNYVDQTAALTQSHMTADGLRNVRRLL